MVTGYRALLSTSLLAIALACSPQGERNVPSGVVHGEMKGAYEPANPPPAPALPRGVYEGEYLDGFEVSAFIRCGSNERWWTSGNLAVVTRFEENYPERAIPGGRGNARLFLRVLATPSATGNHGHLGQYPRQLDVHDVLEVREYSEHDCQQRDGA